MGTNYGSPECHSRSLVMGQGEGASFKEAHLVAWLLGLGLTV